MRRLGLCAGLLMLASPAAASECDALVANIVNTTGVAFVKFASENEAHLKDGDISVRLGCRDRSANIETASIFPPRRFFDLAGDLGGILTGASSPAIRAAAEKCQRRAMQGRGAAMEETPKAYIDCLFMRGASAFVMILPRR